MRSYRLDDEMYGALSIRYLKTVHRYLTEPNLREYSFSTILWLNLRSELNHERRRTRRAPRFVPRIEELHSACDPDSLGCEVLWREIEKSLTNRELEILRHKTLGRSYREIAVKCSITMKAVAGRLYRLRKKIKNL